MEIHSDFDRGSIGALTETKPGHFVGPTKHWIKAAGIGNQYYWFCFRLDGVAGRTLTIVLTDLEGLYRGEPHEVYTNSTQPVVSYDQETWSRITNVRYDPAGHTFQFTHRYDRNTAWVAYAHPYPLAKKEAYLLSIAGSRHVRIEPLGSSREGRPIELVTITDFSTGDEGKKVVFVTGLVHAGEDCSGYFVQGMIDYLLSDEPKALEAGKKTIFKIVPMVNPDGMYRGISRYTAEMEDASAQWSQADPVAEVACVKNWLADWLAAKPIDVVIDVHSHGQVNPQNIAYVPADILSGFVNGLAKHWPVSRSVHAFSGSLAEHAYNQKGIPAITLELTQSHIGDGNYLDIGDYLSYGAATVKAMI